jgi:hypothetical protein
VSDKKGVHTLGKFIVQRRGVLALSFGSLVVSFSALAAPGDLDLTFGGGDGETTVAFSGLGTSTRDVIVRQDGKVPCSPLAARRLRQRFASPGS